MTVREVTGDACSQWHRAHGIAVLAETTLVRLGLDLSHIVAIAILLSASIQAEEKQQEEGKTAEHTNHDTRNSAARQA